MNFDVNRLARLAGLGSPESGQLNEAGNRSQREDPGKPDDVDHRWGKNQISERGDKKDDQSASHRDYEPVDEDLDELRGDKKGDQSASHRDYMDEEEMYEKEVHVDKPGRGKGKAGTDEDVMLEIDENMLRREIRKMRQERLEENRLRVAIRGEIQNVLEDLGVESDSSWVYGDNKPSNSRSGFVNMAFPGIGFK
jgi:hypothetical protein